MIGAREGNKAQRSAATCVGNSLCLTYVFFSIALVWMCSTSTEPPEQVIHPTASASRSFGDPPVDGQLTLLPAADGSIWNYTVDLDGDGSQEEAGSLDHPSQFDYSFTAIGIKRLVATFSSSTQVVTDTLYVIVNDPTVALLRNHADIPGLLNPLRGIVLTAGFLFTTNGSAVERRDPNSFEVLASATVDDSPPKNLQGLAVSPEGLLYAVNKQRPEVLEFAIPQLLHLRSVGSSFVGPFFVDAAIPERLYVGGSGGVAIVDLGQDDVLAERRFVGGWHFAVGAESRTIALVQKGSDPRIRLLNAESLADVWEFAMGNVQPEVVAFSGHDDVIYVLGLDPENNVRFIAIDRTTARAIHSLVLEPCAIPNNCFRLIDGNPVLTMQNFTVMTSGNGAYLISHASHLPLYRIGSASSPPMITCCNVAADEAGSLYFAGHDGSLTSITLVCSPFPEPRRLT